MMASRARVVEGYTQVALALGQLVALIALIAVYHSLRVMPPQLGKSVLQI